MSAAGKGGLLILVRFLDRRYHGVPEWPPSPARLFQALVAAAGPGVEPEAAEALRWLEAIDPPRIAAPRGRRGQAVKVYVPNNDLDSVGGDPSRVDEIRVAKQVQPWLFEEDPQVAYLWAFADDEPSRLFAQVIGALAEKVYQLGRGVDMAYARALVGALERMEAEFQAEGGIVHLPAIGTGGRRDLACPVPGSFDSLEARFQASMVRLASGGTPRGGLVFQQPPRPLFRQVTYDAPPLRAVYELLSAADQERRAGVGLERAAPLVRLVRDAAAERLIAAVPAKRADIEAALIGGKAGEPAVPPDERVRIIPLASIGDRNADRRIRRILVEAPRGGSVEPEDYLWAFSGLEVDLGAAQAILSRTHADGMPRHYGIDVAGRRRWRSVTPVALPMRRARRRSGHETKGSEALGHELEAARSAVMHALRHAGVKPPIESVHVQREPFEARGQHARAFVDERFNSQSLWHVELVFREPVEGPLLIGNGRFFGLGLMAPVRESEGLHAFAIDEGLEPGADCQVIASALRRAVMARAQAVVGDRDLPAFFTGHGRDGAPATDDEPHLTFVADLPRSRLLVLAPHVVEGREPKGGESRWLRYLDRALVDFTVLRAGGAGCLALRRIPVELESDPLFGVASSWQTLTPYWVNRHVRVGSAAEAVAMDFRRACVDAGLPSPIEVQVDDATGVPGRGLWGHVRVVFPSPVAGPLILGRGRFQGSGVFVSSGASE